MNQLKCVHLPIYLDLKIKYMETILNIPIDVNQLFATSNELFTNTHCSRVRDRYLHI